MKLFCIYLSLQIWIWTQPESEIRQQWFLGVVSWDWKETFASAPSSKAVAVHHLPTPGHLKRKASIRNDQGKRHRLPRPFTGSKTSHAQEEPLLGKQKGMPLKRDSLHCRSPPLRCRSPRQGNEVGSLGNSGWASRTRFLLLQTNHRSLI